MRHAIRNTPNFHAQMGGMIRDLQAGKIRFFKYRGEKEPVWRTVPPITYAPVPLDNLAKLLRRARRLSRGCFEPDLATAMKLRGLTVKECRGRTYVRNLKAMVTT